MVWLFQTRHADSVSKPRSFRSATAARRSAQAGQAARLRTMQSRSPAMAQRLLRNTRTVHLLHSPRTTKTPDEENSNRRAVCRRTPRTVRREGRPKSLPYPYRQLSRQVRRCHPQLVDRPRAEAPHPDRPHDERLAAAHVAGGERVGPRGLIVGGVGPYIAP